MLDLRHVKRFLLILGLVFVLPFVFEVPLGAMRAYAELDQVLIEGGWDEIKFDDEIPNYYKPHDADRSDLEGGIDLVSENSVSVAFLTTAADLSKTPRLAWQWRVETPVIDTDLSKKGGDDRSLAVYVAFPYQPEFASFGEKLERTAVEVLKGSDTPGRVLTYVWGGGAPQGVMIENPYAGKYGAFIFLRTPRDSSQEWFSEEVDLRGDFIKAFGYEPAAPVYIGIGADSDDTSQRIEASVRGLVFTE